MNNENKNEDFLSGNENLNNINLPKLEQIGDEFMGKGESVSNIKKTEPIKLDHEIFHYGQGTMSTTPEPIITDKDTADAASKVVSISKSDKPVETIAFRNYLSSLRNEANSTKNELDSMMEDQTNKNDSIDDSSKQI